MTPIRIGFLAAVHKAIDNMLMIVLNNIGGSNIILYYIVDHKYYYADDTALYQAKNEGRDRVVVASTFD